MLMYMQVDWNSLDDIEPAIQVLQHRKTELASEPRPTKPNPAQLVDLIAKLVMLLGVLLGEATEMRLLYVKTVLDGGTDGADFDYLLNTLFKGNYQAFGGVHSAMEKRWKKLLGPAWKCQLIDGTADGKGQVMDPEFRDAALAWFKEHE